MARKIFQVLGDKIFSIMWDRMSRQRFQYDPEVMIFGTMNHINLIKMKCRRTYYLHEVIYSQILKLSLGRVIKAFNWQPEISSQDITSFGGLHLLLTFEYEHTQKRQKHSS